MAKKVSGGNGDARMAVKVCLRAVATHLKDLEARSREWTGTEEQPPDVEALCRVPIRVAASIHTTLDADPGESSWALCGLMSQGAWLACGAGGFGL